MFTMSIKTITLLGLLLVSAMGCGVTQQQRHSMDAAQRSLAQARQNQVAAAEQVVALLDQRERGAEALTHFWHELRSNWARRLREARIDAATTMEEKVAAAESHLAWCRERSQGWMIEDLEVRSSWQSWWAYDIAEAECMLAELKSGG